MPKDVKVLLLVGGAWYHDQPEHREILSEMMSSQFDLTMSDSPDVLTRENLADYDVIVSYTSWWEPTDEQNRALLDAVAGGKGFACLHPSTASFFNCPEHLEMIGGEFIMHDRFKTLTVNVGRETPRERQLRQKGLAKPKEPHPIIEGMENFEVADELFYIQGDQTQWNILARAEGHPVVFTKSWGKGRVFNIALGHDDRPLGNPNVQKLHVRGIRWAAGGL